MVDSENVALSGSQAKSENIVEKIQALSLPADEKEKIISIMMTQSYSGPIMPPQLMRQLEQIIPGGAERVLRLSEKEQDHRHKVVECQVATERWQVKTSLFVGGFAYLVFRAVQFLLGES